LRNLIDYIKEFFFPKICIITNNKINQGNSNDFIDDKAFNSLERLKPDDILDIRDKVQSDYFNSFLAFRKDNSVQTVIHYLKFKGFYKIGLFLGNYFGNEYSRIFQKILEYDLICPVPLFKTKERERGYNQSEYICTGINSILNITQINDLVLRIRHTKSQTNLKYFERLSNVKDAFRINEKYKNSLTGKRILLVDDVVTTGATINEVIKVLRNENVKEISAFTIASAR
jgi:ComF family protein